VTSTAAHPAFGQADLTNCERELIHLAGSIQPHGLLLALRQPAGRVVQASANVAVWLGRPAAELLGMRLADLPGDLDACVHEAMRSAEPGAPQPLRCRLGAGVAPARFEGAVHAVEPGLWVIELEPVQPPADAVAPVALPRQLVERQLALAVQRCSEAASLPALADAVVKSVRELVGYDRVMVYRFDPDGHGQIVAEARDARLEPLLGHRYPASDIPQRARELYLRNRVRVLVDVDYQPAPLEPRLLAGPDGGDAHELDMSMCYLRSMSPLHLQYLRNMGVTATLVVSLVREGQLWGLIACHHYRPRNLRYALRAACELLGEVVATRIAAIENYALAQVAIQVRRLQQRLVEATSTEGDWRLALLRNPGTLLRPLDATGAALFHNGEVLTCGETPSTPELRALLQWVAAQPPAAAHGVAFATASIGRAEPTLASLTPTACGVLAVRLSLEPPEYLMWLRKEQLQTVTWAGDPSKPVISNDPLTLSPRRSFAAWSEIVRGTALPWTAGELAMAGALGDALIDIIVQVNAVRLLIAGHQLAQVRATIAGSKEAVAVVGTADRTFYANEALHALLQGPRCDDVEALIAAFAVPAAARAMIDGVCHERRSWRGELALAHAGSGALPVAARAEPVPARDGALLGVIVILEDLTPAKRTSLARHHLEDALARASRAGGHGAAGGSGGGPGEHLVAAIIANASLAAMDIADGGAHHASAPMLEEVELATARATALYQRIRSFSAPDAT
jgi:light-regulated signal transduction histidine kinase (bacteriophytochrome)